MIAMHIGAIVYFWLIALGLLVVIQVIVRKTIGAKPPERVKSPVSSLPDVPEWRSKNPFKLTLSTEGRQWVFRQVFQVLFIGAILYGLWSWGKYGGESCTGNEVDVAKAYCSIFGPGPKKEGDVTAVVAPSPTPTPIPVKVHGLPANANYRPEALTPGQNKTVCVRLEPKKMNCRLTDGGFPDAVELPYEFHGNYYAHLIEPSGVPKDEQWIYYKINGVVYGPEFPDGYPQAGVYPPSTNWIRVQGSGIIQFTAQ